MSHTLNHPSATVGKRPTGKHPNVPQDQNAGKKAPISWAEKVKVNNAATRFTLEPLPRPPTGHQLVIPEEVMENSDQWERCLVGFFPGYKFPYHAIKSMAMRVWKDSGLEAVQLLGSTVRGPRARTMVVWREAPDSATMDPKGLSMAASMVGTPLSCDEPTHNCSRQEYARICVEIDAKLPYVHQFEVLTSLSTSPIPIQVDYEWKPARCSTCKRRSNSGARPPTGEGRKRLVAHTNLHTTPNPHSSQNRPVPGAKPNPQNASPDPPDISEATAQPAEKATSKSATLTQKREVDPTKAKAKAKEVVFMDGRADTVHSHSGQKNEDVGETSSSSTKTVREWTTKNKLNIIGLLEVKIASSNLPSVIEGLSLDNWSHLSNDDGMNPSRILVGWNKATCNLTSIHSSPQWLTCEVSSINNSYPFRITFVYGQNTPTRRVDLWNYIAQHHYAFSSKSWLIQGDFNALNKACNG
uniref:DUF4283 domain-containing protein n=1 Tax=Salix viminalis TaxID=40686 RepID=A0A6N2N5H3_SALVM